MKKLIFLILLIVSGFQGFSQTPGISYQAVILDPSVQELPGANTQNNILANSNIAVQFTIIDELNNQEYQEYHETSTDSYGMINLIIGHGNTISSNDFEDIVWEGLSKKLRVEIDFSGSRNSFALLSEQELTFMPQPVVGGDAQGIIDNTDAIIAERNRAEQAEAGIQSDVDANEATSNAADTTLQSNINTVQADVDANETAANTAIATANGNITTNTAAIALNTVKVGLTPAQSALLGNTSGINTGDQDISGIAINATNIATNVTAIALNTAKTGITTGQANAIIANTAKVGVPTAYTLPNSDGASNQILQTNGSGVLTWNAPSTTATAYSGVLPLANGGTGSATKNFVDLTTNQTIAGNKIFSSNGSFNGTFIGVGNANGSSNTAVGRDALNGVSTGHRNTAIGQSSMLNYIGTSFDNNTSVGYNNLVGLTTGSGNTSMGAESMMALQTGTSNTSIGNQSLINTTGNNNIGVGQRSGDVLTTGSNNTIVGTRANVLANNQTNATALGYEAIVTASNTIQLGNGSVTDVITSGKLTTGAITLPNTDGTVNQVLQTNGSGVLTWATPTTTATAYSGVLPLANGGTGSATKNFVDLTTNQTIAGTKTFSSNIVARGTVFGAGGNGVASNTAMGTNVLVTNSSGVNNVAIGTQAGFSITGSNNVAIGTATNRNAAEGDSNIAIGNSANYQGTSGANNISLGTLSYRQGNSGSNNVVLGRAALYEETTGSNNIALGNESSRNNNGGEGNITLGYRAGNTITTGDYNLIIGYDADVTSGALTNATAVGNGAIVSASNSIQLGNTSVTDVITSGKLTTGAITLPNTDGTTNQVLQTNGSGVLSWSTPSVAAPVREVADEFSATASQISFTLTQTPSANSRVKMYINGIRISNSAYSVSGTTLTYVSANNGAYTLSASDRIQFDFYY